MPKGVYKRKKAGRSNGSRDKLKELMQHTPLWSTPTEPPTFLSRLEAATVKYEQAINDTITALKGQ
jgi:hypothetical protein